MFRSIFCCKILYKSQRIEERLYKVGIIGKDFSNFIISNRRAELEFELKPKLEQEVEVEQNCNQNFNTSDR